MYGKFIMDIFAGILGLFGDGMIGSDAELGSTSVGLGITPIGLGITPIG
jgi:hypothetical protein